MPTGKEGKVPDDSVVVETDLFEHREVKPHFMNPCCFGEDFAAWLKQELVRFPDLHFELSEAIQEDYGGFLGETWQGSSPSSAIEGSK